VIRVVVVHDQELMRVGLRMIIESDPSLSVVADAGTADEAVRAIRAVRPHVVLVSGRMPDAGAARVCDYARVDAPSTGLLMLSGPGDEEAMLAGLVAGAAVCLSEGMGGDDLTKAVKAVASGQVFLDPEVTRLMLDYLVEGPQRIARGPVDGLSPREHAVLACLGEGLTNKQIAARLGLAEKTIKNYVTAILSELGIRNRSEAAVVSLSVLGRGPRHGSGSQLAAGR
jgi:DNA-binding NarL/FixJ family response regulator